jgi:hypothetical protein
MMYKTQQTPTMDPPARCEGKVQFHRVRAPLSLRLHNQHAVAEHVELIPTLPGNLGVAAHNEILPREGCRKHNTAGPRPVEVR